MRPTRDEIVSAILLVIAGFAVMWTAILLARLAGWV